jgi:hypothetical protein
MIERDPAEVTGPGTTLVWVFVWLSLIAAGSLTVITVAMVLANSFSGTNARPAPPTEQVAETRKSRIVDAYADAHYVSRGPTIEAMTATVCVGLQRGLTAEQVAENIAGAGMLQLDWARRIVLVTIPNAC